MAYKSNSENKIKPRKKSSNAQSIDGDLGGRAGKDREEIELQLNAADSQLDKFRNMMREKDLTIQSLKQEIMVTKQVWNLLILEGKTVH